MTRTTNSFGIGTAAEIKARLRGARNRLAGAITAALREAEADSHHWNSQDRALVHERACLERARDELLAPPPIRESLEEACHRRAAERDFAEMGR